MTACNGCGRCCDPVSLPYTQMDVRLREWLFDPEDARWVLEDLTPLPRREALAKVGDYMRQGGKTAIGLDGEGAVVLFTAFFQCRNYDPETRECAIYDRRPPTCRGYPWYDDGPDPAKAIPHECSYRADVGQPVKLLDTRSSGATKTREERT